LDPFEPDGARFWIVTEHGLRSDYVRNLLAGPHRRRVEDPSSARRPGGPASPPRQDRRHQSARSGEHQHRPQVGYDLGSSESWTT